MKTIVQMTEKLFAERSNSTDEIWYVHEKISEIETSIINIIYCTDDYPTARQLCVLLDKTVKFKKMMDEYRKSRDINDILLLTA